VTGLDCLGVAIDVADLDRRWTEDEARGDLAKDDLLETD
jgi:hypothetical protein